MSYFKYHEDDFEIVNERISKEIDFKPLRRKIIRFNCIFCEKSFTKKDELYEHLKRCHNVSQPLVYINGKVISKNNELYVNHLNDASIILYGNRVPIKIDNELIKNNSGEINIKELLIEKLNTNRECTLEVGNKKIIIYQYSGKNIEYPRMMEVINSWSNQIENGKFIERNRNNEFNDVENIYLDGFFNYFIACKSVSDKSKRYDDAYANLSKIDDLNEIGVLALKIISFRRNWFSKLSQLSFGNCDDFIKIINFIYNDETNTNIEYGKELGSLYIEDEIKENIDAFLAYINKDYVSLDKYLKNIKSSDKNLIDRNNFLSALRARDLSDMRKFNFYKNEILDKLLKERLEVIE